MMDDHLKIKDSSSYSKGEDVQSNKGKNMGAKAKMVVSKKMKKASSALTVSSHKNEQANFLPLEGGKGKVIVKSEEPLANKSKVLYIGHIPHGFYEDQMKGFFSQFGQVKRVKISRSKKTGRTKHYGFLEFENPEVAKIVADEMNNYKLMEHLLQVQLISQENVHRNLWRGCNHKFKVQNWCEIERKRHNKERTVEEHNKLVERILSKDKKRRKKLQDAGIDYVYPDFVDDLHQAPKKIKFSDD